MSPVSAPPLKLMPAPPVTSVKLPVMFGPNITGTGWFYGTETIEYTTGALRGDNTSRTREHGAHGDVVKQYPQLQLDASWSDAQYGAASNVQPNSLRALALIKI